MLRAYANSSSFITNLASFNKPLKANKTFLRILIQQISLLPSPLPLFPSAPFFLLTVLKLKFRFHQKINEKSFILSYPNFILIHPVIDLSWMEVNSHHRIRSQLKLDISLEGILTGNWIFFLFLFHSCHRQRNLHETCFSSIEIKNIWLEFHWFLTWKQIGCHSRYEMNINRILHTSLALGITRQSEFSIPFVPLLHVIFGA